MLVFGLIEDIEGVENAEAIARDGRLDGLVFGPFDLAMALGLDGDVAHPDLKKLHDRVVDACKAAGIEYVTANLAWEFGALENTGSRIVTIAGDRAAVYEGCARALAAFNGDTTTKAGAF